MTLFTKLLQPEIPACLKTPAFPRLSRRHVILIWLNRHFASCAAHNPDALVGSAGSALDVATGRLKFVTGVLDMSIRSGRGESFEFAV
jgi:hypothetical protein